MSQNIMNEFDDADKSNRLRMGTESGFFTLDDGSDESLDSIPNVKTTAQMNKAIEDGEFEHVSKPKRAKSDDTENHISLSKIWDLTKKKRSQGMNQISNSIKLYDKRTRQYISVSAMANVVIDKDNPMSERALKHHNDQVSKIQILFDEFLANVHDKI